MSDYIREELTFFNRELGVLLRQLDGEALDEAEEHIVDELATITHWVRNWVEAQ